MGTRKNRLIEAVLTSTHNLCFAQKYEKYQTFLSENVHFLVVKFSVYLNRHVFVMLQILLSLYKLNISKLLIVLYRNDLSSDLSPKQIICTKYQAIFAEKIEKPALAAMHGPYSLSVAFVHRHTTVYLRFFFTYYKMLVYNYFSIKFQVDSL